MLENDAHHFAEIRGDAVRLQENGERFGDFGMPTLAASALSRRFRAPDLRLRQTCMGWLHYGFIYRCFNNVAEGC